MQIRDKEGFLEIPTGSLDLGKGGSTFLTIPDKLFRLSMFSYHSKKYLGSTIQKYECR